MQLTEVQRADLYNGLSEVLGHQRAELFMSQVPRFDVNEPATKSDLRELRAEFRTELREGLAAVNQRLDRLFLTLLVGMFGTVAALIGVIFNLA